MNLPVLYLAVFFGNDADIRGIFIESHSNDLRPHLISCISVMPFLIDDHFDAALEVEFQYARTVFDCRVASLIEFLSLSQFTFLDTDCLGRLLLFVRQIAEVA